MESEYIDLALTTAIVKAGLPSDVKAYAETDPRLGTVMKRALEEVDGKSEIVQRLKVNSVINWYVRLVTKEVKEVQ